MSDDPLAALEAEYAGVIDPDGVDPDGVDPGSAELEGVTGEVEGKEGEGDNPPGYIDSYDDWIAAGKDPSLFKGKKAYEAEYNRIQEVKSLKDDMRQMNQTLKSTVDAIAERENRVDARHKVELEAALSQAKEDGDTDAAIDALDQLNDINARPAPAPAQQVHPVIGTFISNNPVLEASEMHDEFGRIYNGKLKADGVGKNDPLSDAAIKGYANDAMRSIKTLYPDRFSSPKNVRKTTVRPKGKPAATVDLGQKIKGVRHENLSPQNRGAANDIYEMIKAKSKKPGDKADLAAEQYAKNILGE